MSRARIRSFVRSLKTGRRKTIFALFTHFRKHCPFSLSLSLSLSHLLFFSLSFFLILSLSLKLTHFLKHFLSLALSLSPTHILKRSLSLHLSLSDSLSQILSHENIIFLSLSLPNVSFPLWELIFLPFRELTFSSGTVSDNLVLWGHCI